MLNQCVKTKCGGNLEQNGSLHCVKCGQKYTEEMFCLLKTIYNFYRAKKIGYNFREIRPQKSLIELKKLNLVFHTSKGWFTSTKGQSVVEMNNL